MTKKHFEEAARIVQCISNDSERKKIAVIFATFFKKYNNRFDETKFFEACNMKQNP